MSWDDKADEKVEQKVETSKPALKENAGEEVKQDVVAESKDSTDVSLKEGNTSEEAKQAEQKVESAEPAKEAEVKQSEPMVPQRIIGKVAKSLREKSKSEMAPILEENRQLKERLKAIEETNTAEPEDRFEKEENERIAIKVRETFLKQEHIRGQRKYGQDYLDALELVKSQQDPSLAQRIQWADDPVETLMSEADRIAERLEYGDDPLERERKKEQALEAKLRKKIEAEFAEKLKARNNQPTDVQSVRAAGGDAKPSFKGDSWSTSLPK